MIGIFGGTFDPIHYGHLRPAREVGQALGLESVHIVPAAHPPHRLPPVATPAQRLRMAELAVRDIPGLIADDREIHQGGVSYTVRTLQAVRQEIGAVPLCLLVGTDAFLGLETWYHWRELPELAHLVVMHRPGLELETVPAWARDRFCDNIDRLRDQSRGLVVYQPVTPQKFSATEIRQAIAAGEPVADMLPSQVLEYIRTNSIYRNERKVSDAG